VNIQEYIKKLQSLSELKKQIILWTVVGVFAIILGFFWVKSSIDNVRKIQQSLTSLNLPKIDLQADGNNAIPNIADVANSPQAKAVGDALQSLAASQITDWQTYTNTAYGFQVKYPQNLLIKETILSDGFTSERFEDSGHYPFWLSFGKSDEKNIVDMTNPTLSKYSEIKNGKETINDMNWNTIEEINLPVEGKGTASSLLNAYTQKGDATYVFQCINCNGDIFGDDGNNKKSVFDQIINTFTFIPVT
jgi:hypothetical protein